MATIAAALSTTARAALGILIAASGVELLIVSSEREIRIALDTGQGTVGVIQVFQLSSVGLVNLRPELEDHHVQSKDQNLPGRY